MVYMAQRQDMDGFVFLAGPAGPCHHCGILVVIIVSQSHTACKKSMNQLTHPYIYICWLLVWNIFYFSMYWE
jgi:hypothetical protein